MIRKKRNRN